VTLAILCSGQGGQHAAMFELTARCAPAQSVFDAAAAIAGHDLRQWVGTATPAQRHANPAAQLLCCTQALAAWAALDLQRARPDEDIVLAGYSVGELASWGCAGLIAAADVLQLALARARAMDTAAAADTALVSIRGLQRPALESLCRAHACEVAIVLSEESFIVGGRRESLAVLTRQALASGAQRSTALPIGVAAHTSLLAAASVEFRRQLGAIHSAVAPSPGIRLLSGLDGDVVGEVRSGLDKLAHQISHTLDWSACLTACREAGVTRVLELGPGRALAGMARDAIPQARCRSLEEFRSLEGILSWLHAEPEPG
jgi:[acyl-carrier-protein] S-malonyltransferase